MLTCLQPRPLVRAARYACGAVCRDRPCTLRDTRSCPRCSHAGKVTGREEMALGTPAPSHAPLGEHSGVVLQAVTGVAEVDAGPPATITTVEGQISLSGITYGAALVGEHPNVQTLPVSLFQIGNVGPNHVLPRTAPFADSPPLFAGSGTVDLSALYLPALSASTYVAATTPADIGGAHTALLGTQFTTNAPGVSIFSVSGTCAVPAAVAAARTQLYVTVDSVPPRIGDGALFRTHVADARLLGTQFHCASTQFATVGAAGSHDLSVRGYSEHEDATASMVGVSHVHLPYAQLEAAALPIAIGLNGTGGGWEVALEEFFPLDAGSTAILALRGQVRRGSQSQQLQFRVRVGEAGSEHTLGAPVTVYTAASGVNVATSVELIRFFTLPAAATAGLRVLVEYTAASEIVLEQAALDLVSMRDSGECGSAARAAPCTTRSAPDPRHGSVYRRAATQQRARALGHGGGTGHVGAGQ